MQVNQAKLSDCLSVARIHREYLDQSFLGSLGEGFLTLLYKSLVKSNNSVVIVAKDKEEVVGFVSGIESAGEFYKYFLKNDFLKALFFLLPKIMRPMDIWKMLEILLYPQKNIQANLPRAELLSIAAKKGYQGKGVSKLLFNAFVNEFAKRGIKELRVVVGDILGKAKRFYEKVGCVRIAESELHKGKKSLIYVYRNRECGLDCSIYPENESVKISRED